MVDICYIGKEISSKTARKFILQITNHTVPIVSTWYGTDISRSEPFFYMNDCSNVDYVGSGWR